MYPSVLKIQNNVYIYLKYTLVEKMVPVRSQYTQSQNSNYLDHCLGMHRIWIPLGIKQLFFSIRDLFDHFLILSCFDLVSCFHRTDSIMPSTMTHLGTPMPWKTQRQLCDYGQEHWTFMISHISMVYTLYNYDVYIYTCLFIYAAHMNVSKSVYDIT